MERYPNRAEYLRRVEEAAPKLAKDRDVREEDVAGIVEHAGLHCDFVVSRVTPR
jgi:hypothetical protein